MHREDWWRGGEHPESGLTLYVKCTDQPQDTERIINKRSKASVGLGLGISIALMFGGTTAVAVIGTQVLEEVAAETELPAEAVLPAEEGPSAETASAEGILRAAVALKAPTYTAQALRDPTRFVVSNIAVPGTPWKQIKDCGFTFDSGGSGSFASIHV